ncbi:MAG: ATP-binding cassette domain-containing protein [Actinobacteria bacterium]|nr:ATP-binding cassette domain-containing protein [Actinomycetota bacterium]
MLAISNLYKTYGDVIALDGCTFAVEPGQLLGFLGPNGAGKTTAMRAIFNLIKPDRGSVTWRGEPIDPQIRRSFGYMPEQRGLYPKMRVKDQLVFLGRLHGMERRMANTQAALWLERLGLAERAGDRLEELSHGNQQRVQLAAAVVHDPELLVLDEPFSGLDPIGVGAMTEILSEYAARGTCVVFSSHQLDLVEDLCEDVVVINEGKVALDGAVRDLRNATDHRYLEIETSNASPDWLRGIPDTEFLSADGPTVRLKVPTDFDFAEVLRNTAGTTIERFSFLPPTLSEIFREAVGQ